MLQLLLLSFRVEDTRMELLPELMKLTEDEESAVRLAAFDTTINLMEIMDSGESSASSEAGPSILPFWRLNVTKQTHDEQEMHL